VNNALGGYHCATRLYRFFCILCWWKSLWASITVDENGNMQEDVDEAVKHQANRTAMIASWIKNGKQ
jgi:hypothetical protein